MSKLEMFQVVCSVVMFVAMLAALGFALLASHYERQSARIRRGGRR